MTSGAATLKLLDQIASTNNENLARLSQDLALTQDESMAVLRAVLPPVGGESPFSHQMLYLDLDRLAQAG